MNLVAVFRERNAARLETTALAQPNGLTVSYSELFDRAAQYGAALIDADVQPGDRVLVQVPKSIENMALYLGVVHCGAVYVTLNTAYTDAEVDYFVSDAAPTVAVFDPATASRRGAGGTATIWTLDDDGQGTAAQAADAHDASLPVYPVTGEDPAAMLYTSGTTGRSKGAVLSHRALTNNVDALAGAWAFTDADVVVHALPIFHTHGLFVALHCAWWTGARTIVLSAFDPSVVRRCLLESSVFMGVPTYYTRLLADGLNRTDCASMRLFTSGSAPMTTQTHHEFTAATTHHIVERYGMTEAGMITSNPYDGDKVPGTVGFALDGVSVRIADDGGHEAPIGTAGVVQIQSTSLFSGYWNLPDKTEEAFVDGWFVTGDIGSLDADGRLTLEGRASDMIISGGLNIYPKEIELAIDATPGVVESAVIGVPHPDFGEAVVAVVVGDTDAVAIAMSLDDTLARFKHPKHVEVVDTLPRNAMGKIEKKALRQRYEDVFHHG